MKTEGGYTTQEQLIRACGEGICNIVKIWKPAIAIQRCRYCGRKFYHIAEHEDECRELTDDERWQQFCDEAGFKFAEPTEPVQPTFPDFAKLVGKGVDK